MKGIDGNKNRIQRRNQVLCDVRYIIEAHVQNTEKAHPGKTPWRTERRIVDEIAKGKCYKQPYFGCREYTGYFAPCDEIPPCPESLRGEMEFGFMLWGKDYSNQEDVHSQYFNAVLKDGVLNVPPPGSKEIIQWFFSLSSIIMKILRDRGNCRQLVGVMWKYSMCYTSTITELWNSLSPLSSLIKGKQRWPLWSLFCRHG